MELSFSQLVSQIETEDDHRPVKVPNNWMQGRTTYGGLSAALCLQAVLREYPDLPPLRSAQITFIGPAGGTVTFRSKILRQGRSVTYVEAEMDDQNGIATHVVFCFGAERESNFDQTFSTAPKVPGSEKCENFFKGGTGPLFTQYFEVRLAKGGIPFSGSEHNEHLMWARHKDSNATDLVALLGLADIPPPAVLPMFKEFAPASSMTWMINLLVESPTTNDGWWLVRSAAEHARHGYSSQDMSIWNTDGELVITAKQNVAMFY